MGDREYIDSKFDKIISNIKWGVGILITILLVFSSAIGANTIRSLNNKGKVEAHESVLENTVTKSQMERLIQFSNLKKEVVMTVLEGRTEDEIDALWSKLEELEMMVINDDYGVYFRESSTGSYKEKIMDSN